MLFRVWGLIGTSISYAIVYIQCRTPHKFRLYRAKNSEPKKAHKSCSGIAQMSDSDFTPSTNESSTDLTSGTDLPGPSNESSVRVSNRCLSEDRNNLQLLVLSNPLLLEYKMVLVYYGPQFHSLKGGVITALAT